MVKGILFFLAIHAVVGVPALLARTRRVRAFWVLCLLGFITFNA